MAGGFARVAQALAEVAAGVGGGYGQGMGMDYMNARQDYHARLKAASEAEQQRLDRVYRTEEAEKGRGFQKEMASGEREWEKEKFGMEQAAEDARFEKESALQIKLKGMGGGAAKVDGVERTITDENGKVWGVTNTGKTIDLGIKEKLPANASDGIERTITDESGKVWGVTNTGKTVDLGLKEKATAGAKDTAPKEFSADVNKAIEARGHFAAPGASKFNALSPEEKFKAVAPGVASTWKSSGRELPEAVQQSVIEAPQPQGFQAPATDTSGDKPTLDTPKGQGTEASPFIITSEKQSEWVRTAPPGSYFVINGEVRRKKGIEGG